MRPFPAWLTSIRGQVVAWYLVVFAVLLIGLGIFQSFMLRDYVRSTTAETMHDSARAVLENLGPCLSDTPADLAKNASVLARLLGSHEIAVKIVTPGGQTLADHALGPPGAGTRLQLSATLIRSLIRSAAPHPGVAPADTASACSSPSPPPPGSRSTVPAGHTPSILNGDLLLIAVPLGAPENPVGYAILGRNVSDGLSTVGEARVTFTLGALAAMLLAMLVAIPLVHRALRPLNRVTRIAEVIAEGDIEQRANLTHSADEIGRLGRSFDTMVDRLQEALSASRASEERMREFLADASHELRTPLTVLRGTSQVLLRQRDLNRDEVESSLRAIHDESVRLSRLVDDLLTLSRLDAGGMPLQPRSVNVRAFLEEFLDRYSMAWSDRRISLNVGNLDGAEVSVDPEALRRILTNLVENAARYSTPGCPITLSEELAGNHVSIGVHDAGPGLTPEEAARAFDRFYRSSRSRSRQTGGTGLGLAIVRALVQESQGEVSIDTGPERGTTVTVTLPTA